MLLCHISRVAALKKNNATCTIFDFHVFIALFCHWVFFMSFESFLFCFEAQIFTLALSIVSNQKKSISSSQIYVKPASVAFLLGVEKLMGSMLGPNRAIAKTLKDVPTAAMSDARH